MKLQSGGGKGRVSWAVIVLIAGLLIGAALAFLVDPGEMKQAVMARLFW